MWWTPVAGICWVMMVISWRSVRAGDILPRRRDGKWPRTTAVRRGAGDRGGRGCFWAHSGHGGMGHGRVRPGPGPPRRCRRRAGFVRRSGFGWGNERISGAWPIAYSVGGTRGSGSGPGPPASRGGGVAGSPAARGRRTAGLPRADETVAARPSAHPAQGDGEGVVFAAATSARSTAPGDFSPLPIKTHLATQNGTPFAGLWRNWVELHRFWGDRGGGAGCPTGWKNQGRRQGGGEEAGGRDQHGEGRREAA